MTRKKDVDRFYLLFKNLEKIIGGKRVLSECNGSMNWPRRGVYFFFEDSELRENGDFRAALPPGRRGQGHREEREDGGSDPDPPDDRRGQTGAPGHARSGRLARLFHQVSL